MELNKRSYLHLIINIEYKEHKKLNNTIYLDYSLIMILYFLLCLPIVSQSISCQKRRCHSNQIDTSEEMILDRRNKPYSCWYKYHLWTKGPIEFAILTDDFGEFQTIVSFAFTVTINNQIATHQFEYKNSTFWDKQLVIPLKEDQDAWHYLSLHFQEKQIYIQLYFNNQIYTGTNKEFFFLQINIANIPFQPHVLVIICQAYHSDQSFEFFQTCDDDLESNHTLSYSPDILTYQGNEFNMKNALIHVWLKDQQENSYFTFNIRQSNIYGVYEKILSIDKTDQRIVVGFYDWNDTFRIKLESKIASQSELKSWYFLYVDHSKQTYLQTVRDIYQTTEPVIRLYPNAEYFFSLYQTSFADFMITDINQLSCPPNCEQCNQMRCLKCKGNRVEPDCTCPLYQIDYGQLNCECIIQYNLVPYKIRPFDIISKNHSCITGYLVCSDEIQCDHGYIRYQNKCYKCPNLGNEVCQQCITQVEVFDMLNCLYTYQENLLLYKKNQINDFMSFFQQRSYYDETGQYFGLDLASVNIIYQPVNGIFEPIRKSKNSDLICPYHFQAKFYIQGQVACIKIPKGCNKFDPLGVRLFCQICKKGYSMIQYECMKCPQYCQSCNQFKCTSCSDEYYLSLDGSCRKCLIINCKSCYEYNNGYLSLNDDFQYSKQIQYCALCEDNYEFNYESLKCQPKSGNCPISIFNQDSICLVDQSENQNKLSQKCQQLNCVLCYKTQCLKCQKGYYLDNQLCKQCKFEYIQKPRIGSRSSNSELFCELQDLINYQHTQYDLQHIILLHTQQLFKQIPLTMQIISCLNNEILYDSLYCQPRNNEFVNQNQIDYCHKFIYSSNNQPYCIEIAPGLNNMVIERETGLVKYCNGYQYCNIQVNYFLEQIENHYVYKNYTYYILSEFIDSIDYEFLKTNYVKQINIYLPARNGDLYYKGNLSKQIPINIIATMDTTPNPIILMIDIIRLINVNNLIIDNLIGFTHNMIKCRNLTIMKYDQRPLNLPIKEYQMIINHQIETQILIIKQMNISDGIIEKQPLFELSQQNLIIIDSIEIENNCLDAYYFKLFNNTNVTILISSIIIKESSFENCSLIDLKASYILQIDNLTILNSLIQYSLFINCNNVNISTIFIYNSTIFNSTIISTTNTLFVNQKLLIVKSYFYLSKIFCASQQSKKLYINQMQLSKSLAVDSQLFNVNCSSIVIESLDLKDINALSMNVQQSLVHLISEVVFIKEFRNFYFRGNTSILSISAQAIYLQRLEFKDNTDSYQFGYIDEYCQFSLQQQEYYKFMVIKDFSIFSLKDSIFKNIYTTEQLFNIQSTQHSTLYMKNITIQRMQIFSNSLIEIKSDIVIITSIIFHDIWFHDILQTKYQMYYLMAITSLNIEATNLYFLNIKNINVKQFKWFIGQTRDIIFDNIIFNQKDSIISNFINQSLNVDQVSYLDNSTGNYQLLYINCNYLFMKRLSIRNLPSNSEYMIQITSNQQIDILNVSQIVIESKDSYYFFKGLIIVNTTIINAFITDINIIRIYVQKYLFHLRAHNLHLSNQTVRIIHGGILNCQLVSFTSRAYVYNAKIYRNNNSEFFVKQYVLFLFENGQIYYQINRQIDLQKIRIRRVQADVIHIENAVSVILMDISLLKGQFINELIKIKSSICQHLLIKNIEIKKYFRFQSTNEINFFDQMMEQEKQLCWFGSLTKESHSMIQTDQLPKTLFDLQIESQIVKSLDFSNIILISNSDLQSLIIFNTNQIRNITLKNNTCKYSCIRREQNYIQIQTRKQYKSDELKLEIRHSQFVQNTGILFDTELHQFKLYHTFLQHNDTISQYIEYLDLNDSQILYQSRLSVDQIQLFNDSSILNQESVHLQISHKPQLLLSFDNQNTYYPTINNSVIFYNKQLRQFNYCNFPTGQSVGEYERLSLQNINYTKFIKEMKFALRPKSDNSECKLKYQNISVNFQLNSQNWNQLKLIANPLDKSLIKFEVQCDQANLNFLVQVLKCQLGEILLNNQCTRCDYFKNYYSVNPKAVHCLIINEQINATLSGLISLKSGFWRPYFTNNEIAKCPDMSTCHGGWGVGDQTCKIGYIGAACQECDLYSIKGQGKFIKNNNECQLCKNSYYSYISFALIVILQLVLLHSNNLSWASNMIKMRNLRLFQHKRFFILYKYALGSQYINLDQMTFILEIMTNFIQLFLIINQNAYIMPDIISSMLSSYSNPNININSLIQCYLSNYFNSIDLMYIRGLTFIISFMLFVNLYYACLGFLMIFKQQRYHAQLFLLVLNYIIIHNYINFAEVYVQMLYRIIQLSTWRTISGINWVNSNLSIPYMSQIARLSIIILPCSIIMIIIIPGMYFKILHQKSNDLKYFIQWGYFYQKYKAESKYWVIIIIYFKIAIVTASYSSNLLLLLLILIIQYSLILRIQPYLFKKLNQLNSISTNLLIIIATLYILLSYSQNYYLIIKLCIKCVLSYQSYLIFQSCKQVIYVQIIQFSIRLVKLIRLHQIENLIATQLREDSNKSLRIRSSVDKIRMLKFTINSRICKKTSLKMNTLSSNVNIQLSNTNNSKQRDSEQSNERSKLQIKNQEIQFTESRSLH